MSDSDLPAVLIEAFSAVPFGGNGAAVVALQEPPSPAWMQALAASLNQSETAFLLESQAGWLLRWFTTRCEVPLCGHATLAALLALAHWGRIQPGERILLHSRSGPLEVGLPIDRPDTGTLVLPSTGLDPATPPPALLDLLDQACRCAPEGFWHSELGYRVALLPPHAPLGAMACPADQLDTGLGQGLVLMQALEPDANQPWIDGAPADYQLRFFAPGLGIPEDPVTGSAHALVAPWWLERLGQAQVRGWQCSDRPGGMVCEAASSGMIRLTGSGHLLWDGTLRTASRGCAAHPPDGSDGSVGALAKAWDEWFTAIPWPYSTRSAATPS